MIKKAHSSVVLSHKKLKLERQKSCGEVTTKSLCCCMVFFSQTPVELCWYSRKRCVGFLTGLLFIFVYSCFIRQCESMSENFKM